MNEELEVTEPETGQVEKTQEETKTFTQEDINDIVSKRLERERKKLEDDFKNKLEETERLAKLSEKEKTQELEKQRIKDLEEREKQLTRKTLELDAVEELNNRSLPTSFKNLVVGQDAEETFNNIKVIEESFRDAVQQAVNERLKNTDTPKIGTSKEGMTKEDFDKLGYSEVLLLKQNNPELYNKLIKRG